MGGVSAGVSGNVGVYCMRDETCLDKLAIHSVTIMKLVDSP